MAEHIGQQTVAALITLSNNVRELKDDMAHSRKSIDHIRIDLEDIENGKLAEGDTAENGRRVDTPIARKNQR